MLQSYVDEFWLVQPLDCPLLINVIDPILDHLLESYNCQKLVTVHRNCYSLNTHRVGSTPSPCSGTSASPRTVLASFPAKSSPRLLLTDTRAVDYYRVRWFSPLSGIDRNRIRTVALQTTGGTFLPFDRASHSETEKQGETRFSLLLLIDVLCSTFSVVPHTHETRV